MCCCLGESGAKPDGWRSGPDLKKMYESVTPNPTGSLSGPYFLQDTGGTVTGGHSYRWAQLQVGTVTGGHSYRWAQLQVGTVTGGHSYRWPQLQVATVTGRQVRGGGGVLPQIQVGRQIH